MNLSFAKKYSTDNLYCFYSYRQGASVISAAGEVFVRGERWGPKRFPWGVFGQPEAGTKQEQRNEGKHQEVSGRGQKTGGIRGTEASPKEIC